MTGEPIPVIILGPGNSGSSAVLDYLVGRGDVTDSMPGQEFRLIQEKDGLSTLHRALTTEVHPEAAMYALIAFRKMAARLGEPSRKLRLPPRLGYGFSERIPGYDAAIEEFLQAITAAEVNVYPLQDMLQFTLFDWLRFRRKQRPRSSAVGFPKPFPVGAEEFMAHARRLIARLFYEPWAGDPNRKPYLAFDQSGSFWSPVSSTAYYGERRKVVLMTRSPCDTYVSQHRKGNVHGAPADFAKLQRALIGHVNWSEWADPRVLHLTFEGFVTDHERDRQRLCAHLGLDPAVPSTYDPRSSQKSVGRYRSVLSPADIALLEQASFPAGPTSKPAR